MPYANKEKQKQAQHQSYLRNKINILSRNQVRRYKGKAFSDRVKTRLGCIDCGYDKHPAALTFDHVRGEKKKTKNGKPIDISKMYRHSLETLKDEMRKCEVRCANCHNIVTNERLLRNVNT